MLKVVRRPLIGHHGHHNSVTPAWSGYALCQPGGQLTGKLITGELLISDEILKLLYTKLKNLQVYFQCAVSIRLDTLQCRHKHYCLMDRKVCYKVEYLC